jgi:hypothetical protein
VTENLIDIVARSIHDSELLSSARHVRHDGGRRFALEGAPVRSLRADEIAMLESLGNHCNDWSAVLVVDGFEPCRVRESYFQGQVVLGRFSESASLSEGVEIPTGIYRSTVVDCVVGNDALVRNTGLLAHYVVGARAVISDCTSIVCTGATAFGNGQTLQLGIETGGRDLQVFAEITLPVCAALTRQPGRRFHLKTYTEAIAEYVGEATSSCGIIGSRATVRGTPKVNDTFIGPHAVVDGAAAVECCTLLSNAAEPVRIGAGACVAHSLLQWGSSCDTGALVDRSVLMEHSHVRRQGRVAASAIGPNTSVEQAEVTASLLGPFVGLHHSALVIAVSWPEGKGNISHGAAVGCNHTSRAPDQECWLGEGTFVGLGTTARFPLNLSGAPYCVVACDIELPPQKLLFPFSLIRQRSSSRSNIPPACNELVPAWLLSDNLFAVRRTQSKFQARNRARRHRFEFEVFRPETIDSMRNAVNLLRAVELVREVYSEHEIAGLGKNYITESHRWQAMMTYDFFIRHYALRGLLEQSGRWLREGAEGTIDRLLTEPSYDPCWEHQRQLLCEDLRVPNVATALRELPEMLQHVGAEVEQSKRRDDQRGAQIIEDYADVHTPAGEDRIVRESWLEVRRLQAEVRRVLNYVQSGSADGGPPYSAPTLAQV